MNSKPNPLLYLVFVPVIIMGCNRQGATSHSDNGQGRSYYVSPAGDDRNPGSINKPWRTLEKISNSDFNPGDSILLLAGKVFEGTLLLDSLDSGTIKGKIFIGSYGLGKAIINSADKEGMIIKNCDYFTLCNLIIKGAGRKEGNTRNGVTIAYCDNSKIDSLEVSGYQKSGLLLRNSSNMSVQNVYTYDNGFAGISVEGENQLKTDCRNINIRYCRAENNPGDPTNFDNHSGNGIIVSQCTRVTIAYCSATNNGWDMPRVGNGPVGIWAWDADSVTIEHCLSYRNKTSKGGEDGGGYDFDGGITNSVIQYCLSYENEGSGIGLFQYDNAGPWENNTIRYNISINDGNVSSAKAGIYIWSANKTNKLKNCRVYNNTIYNSKNAAISYAPLTVVEDFVFFNNILAGKKEIISGNTITGKFAGNCWWSIEDGFKVNQITDLNIWRVQKQQETLNGMPTGINIDPGFINMSIIAISDAKMLSAFQSAKAVKPAFVNGGINVHQLFGLQTVQKDFNENNAPVKGIGASF
jgi:hypothetical protein